MRTRTAVTAVLAGALLLVVSVAGFYTVVAGGRPAADPVAGDRVDPLTGAIAAAQRRLERVPGDYDTWARLGAAYVEQRLVVVVRAGDLHPLHGPGRGGRHRPALVRRHDRVRRAEHHHGRHRHPPDRLQDRELVLEQRPHR